MVVIFFFKFGEKYLFAMDSSHGCQNVRYQHRIKASSTSSFDRWIVQKFKKPDLFSVEFGSKVV